jgi:phage gpG-like protein
VIAFEMDTAPALAALQQEIESLPPRLMLKASSVLRPMVYAALNTSLQKYFSGSAPARGPAAATLTSRSGNLFNSVLASLQVAVNADSIDLSIGSALPYAAIQEYGGYAGRPGPFKKKTGHRPYLPARPYLQPAMDDLAEALPGLLDQALNQVAGDQ